MTFKWIPDKLQYLHLSSFEWNCQTDLVIKKRTVRSNIGLLATLPASQNLSKYTDTDYRWNVKWPANEIVPTWPSGMTWITLPFDISAASPTRNGCARPLANDTNSATSQSTQNHVTPKCNMSIVKILATTRSLLWTVKQSKGLQVLPRTLGTVMQTRTPTTDPSFKSSAPWTT